MLTTRGLMSVLVVFLQAVFAASVIGTSLFVIERDRKISTSWFRALVIHSTKECVALCQITEGCTAANYMPPERICYLFNKICFRTEYAPGWTYIRLTPAQKTFYHYSNNKKTWDDAKMYCESNGGRLANIMSPTDLELILSSLDPNLPATQRIWIGGSDMDSEGDWIWSNGCKFSDHDLNYWMPRQPDNNNATEHCLELWNAQWNDQKCERIQTFVCEDTIV